LCYLALVFVAYVAFVDNPSASQPTQARQPRQALRPPAAGTPTIHLSAQPGRPARFEVHDLPAELLSRLAGEEAAPQRAAMLTVAVAPAAGQEPSPMLGSHRVEGGLLLFEPRFPLSPGVTYLARWLPPQGEAIVERFTIARPEPAERTVVMEIFPTSSELPENQLKFYVHFSAAMSRGQAYRHIRLLKADGRPVEGGFLEIAEELWDPAGTRFTLLLDPGRVKRGLKPREEDGPVLEEGHRYTLAIDGAWQDAAGFELKQSHRKSFAVLAPDDEPPDTANWKLEPPTAANQQTLTVSFPEPLDRALLERVVWVETSDGQRVEGTIEIDRHETRWRFRPSQPWQAGESYVLAVERILEDRAGNRLGRKFEVDVFEKIDRQVLPEIVRLPFTASRD
jgi:hypothetical protein